MAGAPRKRPPDFAAVLTRGRSAPCLECSEGERPAAANEKRKEKPMRRGGNRFEPYGNPSRRYRAFITNIPFDVKWQSLKDLVKEKGNGSGWPSRARWPCRLFRWPSPWSPGGGKLFPGKASVPSPSAQASSVTAPLCVVRGGRVGLWPATIGLHPMIDKKLVSRLEERPHRPPPPTQGNSVNSSPSMGRVFCFLPSSSSKME